MSTELQTELEKAKEAALEAARIKDAEIGPLTVGMFDDTCEECVRELSFSTAKAYISRNGLNERTLAVVNKFFDEALAEIVNGRQMGWSYLGPKLDMIIKDINDPQRERSDREIGELAHGQALGIQALLASAERSR